VIRLTRSIAVEDGLAMVTRVAAEPKVLEWARKASGLTIEEAADRLNRKRDYIRNVEEGRIQASASLFRDMATCYGFPEATLLAVEPPSEVELPRDYRTFDGGTPN
jgi:transcriptional regulator with XRE-family HTH domain